MQPQYGSNTDAYVTELNTTGGSVLYSTFWGGTGGGTGMDIGPDAAGDVFVVGTAGAGFPTTAGAYRTSGPGFVLKITP